MSGKCHRKCPEIVHLFQKMSGKRPEKWLYLLSGIFSCPDFVQFFFGHEKFQTNFGQIKQTNSGHENFQINYWTNSGYEKNFEEILDSILKFFTKNAKLSKLTFKTFIDILRKNEEQAKILYIYDVNLSLFSKWCTQLYLNKKKRKPETGWKPDKIWTKTGRILVFEYSITNKLHIPFENGDKVIIYFWHYLIN